MFLVYNLKHIVQDLYISLEHTILDLYETSKHYSRKISADHKRAYKMHRIYLE